MNSHSTRSAGSDAIRVAGQRVSLIIPAWNEQDTISQAIREADAALKAHVAEYEIIVVDDGSTDRTCEIVMGESVTYPAVRLVRHGKNIGYGAALRTGFKAAEHELVAFTDADCQFDLNDLEYMLPLAERYDVVSGYRIDRKDSVIRRFYSWGYNTVVQLLLGSAIRDIDCALKIFHRRHLEQILPEADKFFANTEMLSKTRANGLSVVDIGVQHRPRAAGQSKVSIKAIPSTLNSLLPFWWTRSLFEGGAAVAAKRERYFWPAFVLLIAVTGLMLYPNLSYSLLEPDEARYAEIAREMVVSGDWVVPQFLYEPYLDKPPMFYWLCAISYQVFGPSDWAARLVPATAAFLTVIATFLFGSRMLGLRAGFVGSLVLILSFGFACCGRFLILDSLLSCFVVISLLTAYEAIRGERLNWFWWIVSALVCGLGVMTKGPVAVVLLVPPVIAHCWLGNLPGRPRLSHWLAYGAVAVGVAIPWYAAIAKRDPQFAYYFFWQQNISRFLSGSQHPHGAWYYIPVTLLSWMPWGLLLLPLAYFLFARSKALARLRPLPLGYFVLWAGWCLLFFSVSAGKLPPYILPAFPPMGLLLGFMLAQVSLAPETGGALYGFLDRLLRLGMPLFCVAGIILSAVAGLLHWNIPAIAGLKTCAWIAAMLVLYRYRSQFQPRTVVSICGLLAFITVGEVVQHDFPAWAEQFASLPSAGTDVTAKLRNDAIPIACYNQRSGAIPFYLQRDDVEHFVPFYANDLTRFVQESGQAYIVVDDSIGMSQLVEILPPGTSVSKMATSHRSIVVLVQTPDEQLGEARQKTAAVPRPAVGN